MFLACLFLAISESFLGILGLRSHTSYPHCPTHTYTPLLPGNALCSSESPCFTLHLLLAADCVKLLLRLLPPALHHLQTASKPPPCIWSFPVPRSSSTEQPSPVSKPPCLAAQRSGCLWFLTPLQAQSQPSLVRSKLSYAPFCLLS